jgi:hypothetical protein
MTPLFFMVWRNKGPDPRVKHQKASDAAKEATRLAAKHPGKEFFVLAAIASCRDEPAEVEPPADVGRALGGYARAQALTPERRSEIARDAANARWRAGEVEP